jgi:hypothetical protein
MKLEIGTGASPGQGKEHIKGYGTITLDGTVIGKWIESESGGLIAILDGFDTPVYASTIAELRGKVLDALIDGYSRRLEPLQLLKTAENSVNIRDASKEVPESIPRLKPKK